VLWTLPGKRWDTLGQLIDDAPKSPNIYATSVGGKRALESFRSPIPVEPKRLNNQRQLNRSRELANVRMEEEEG